LTPNYFSRFTSDRLISRNIDQEETDSPNQQNYLNFSSSISKKFPLQIDWNCFRSTVKKLEIIIR
jgi:hypothetical protein